MPAAECPQSVLRLVDLFDRNRSTYRSRDYLERDARTQFIEPLFEALGWDVRNVDAHAEAYKDVVQEHSIKTSRGPKAPDYCFRVGGTRKFFVEAKRPAADIAEDATLAYQLRRYAWSGKLPLSILTDFEELAVYDCRTRPVQSDRASKARTMYFGYREYADRWGELSSTFSKQAVFDGSFDRYAESTRRKRGTAEVDEEFLKDIERWRELLARNIALRNPGLSTRELNFAVARTIDRVIFLRMCEDRGVEDYGRLQALLNGTDLYGRLCELFSRADERYNSGLFHFRLEKGRPEPPDELTPNLEMDDRALKDILKGLYYPESPYEFSVLPADILGQVYEQFLGKVIRLTPAHRAVVEDKPEVKKAGGVYYTPTYIVDYIVEHTVGALLEDTTPRDVAGIGRGRHPLRVLDPACGSGSFLIGAYQRLLDWHRDWYAEHLVPLVEKGKDAGSRDVRRLLPQRASAKPVLPVYEGRGGEWRLTTAERKRILLTCIHGVDIDPQAVEVTKLSLLLKVLEGENRETLERQQRLFHERALPDLAANVKCGNSLIGPDFYEGRQSGLFDEEERYRINAFDWEAEFPEVFAGREGGFDAVIGNPPYIRIQALRAWMPWQADYFGKRYRSAASGSYDIYVVFVEQGLLLLALAGRLGYILPSKFMATDYGEPLRGLIADRGVLDEVVDFEHEQVFDGPTTYTCLLFLDRGQRDSVRYRKAPGGAALPDGPADIVLEAETFSSAPWVFVKSNARALLDRMAATGTPLLELPALMSRGVSTGADSVFCVRVVDGRFLTRDGEAVELENEVLRQPVYATDFQRYLFLPSNDERIVFPYSVREDSYELMSESLLRRRYPLAYSYLRTNRSALQQRKQYKRWYAYSAPRNLHVHDAADLIVPLLANTGLCAPMPDAGGPYCVMASAGFTVTLSGLGTSLSRPYVLGLLNSRLLFWNLQLISNKFRGGWITCTKQYFGKLPIRTIDSNDAHDVVCHDRMVALVDRASELRTGLSRAKTPHGKKVIEREIEATDRQIDRLVYELYELTDEEIAIVEEATNV